TRRLVGSSPFRSDPPREAPGRCRTDNAPLCAVDNLRSCGCHILHRLPGLVAAKDLLAQRFASSVHKFVRFLADGEDSLRSLAKLYTTGVHRESTYAIPVEVSLECGPLLLL